MIENSSEKKVPRASHQARGHARIEMILNTTATMIAESGVASVTMHQVAKRAQTSVGSMYHFFPDRERLLQMLTERHAAAIRLINQEVSAIPAKVWRELSATATIKTLVTPYVEYINQHPDFLAMMHGRSTPEDDADFIRIFRYVLSTRLTLVDEDLREDYVAVMHAIAAGGMHIGYQSSPERAELYLREIPRALAAYLTSIEQTHGSNAVQPFDLDD